ncbi:hypothetical protein BKA62DRAFT_625065 [Auriculariales sp. MPI-PUGE-AT-0066]|nr:hypothetical protein BKA62DRAFT_625065 [Auriculariales sp. MPI-PUGE-AT-0066]
MLAARTQDPSLLPLHRRTLSQAPTWTASELCTCRISGCGKTYNRVYDLLRHLAGRTHRSYFTTVTDGVLLGAGVPSAYLSRAHELLGRDNKCEVCSQAFSRRDALLRHQTEMGHRPAPALAPAPAPAPASPSASAYPHVVAPVPSQPQMIPPPGYQWALVPNEQVPMPMNPFFDVAVQNAFGVPLQQPAQWAPPVPAAPQQQPSPPLFEETMAMWFGSSAPYGGAPF